MTKLTITRLLFLLLALCVGCKSNPNANNSGKAMVSFNIDPAILIDVEQGTKAVAPAANDFTITVTLKGETTPTEQFLYKNCPTSPIALEPGSYTFECRYGDKTLASTDIPAYEEVQELDLTGRVAPYTVNFKPTRANICLEAIYPVGFEKYYSDYHILVSSPDLGSDVTFGAAGQSAVHYLKYGSVYKVSLVASNIVNSLPVVVELANIAADAPTKYHKLNLAFPAPKFTSPVSHAITETVTYEASTDITYTATSAIKTASLVVNFVNPEIAEAVNGTYTLDAATISTLANKGVICEIGDFAGKIAMSGALRDKMLSFSNANTDYTLSLNLTDVNGKTTSQTTTYTVTPPAFEIPDMQASFWSKTLDEAATLSIDDVTLGAPETILDKLTYKISTDGSNWTVLTPVSGKLSATGLTPNTEYIIAATYRDITATRTFRTEEQRQIPNSNFESWVDTRETQSKQPYFRLREADGTEWWDTRNSVTCPANGSNYSQCSSSSTRKTAGYKGNGAIIHTAGWGKGNTYVELFSAIIYNITPGALFVGEYNGSEKYGKEFKSRPTSISFYYKYDPYGTGDKCTAKVWVENRTETTTTKLGEGVFQSGASVNSFKNQSVNITYTNILLPPTHICVAFYCGDLAGDKKYIKDWSKDDNGYWYGARMWVDEVELTYGK